MTQTAQILAALFYLLQQNVHVTARSKKKFQGKRWPHPDTAADVVKREDADQGHRSLMADVVFMDQDEFDAFVEQHRADEPEIRRTPGVETVVDDPVDSLHDSDRSWLDAHSPGWDQPAQ